MYNEILRYYCPHKYAVSNVNNNCTSKYKNRPVLSASIILGVRTYRKVSLNIMENWATKITLHKRGPSNLPSVYTYVDHQIDNSFYTRASECNSLILVAMLEMLFL